MRKSSIDHDLYRGTLDILVLALISRQSDHGYGLVERLRAHSGGQMEVSEGAIYPLLHRLDKKGLITFEWKFTANHRRAKHYTITDAGRSILSDRSTQWRSLSRVMDELIEHIKPGIGASA